MPIYEYRCDCGARLEEYRSIESRHNVTCRCGRVPKIVPSIAFDRKAEFFSVLDHDGTILHHTIHNEAELDTCLIRGPLVDYRGGHRDMITGDALFRSK